MTDLSWQAFEGALAAELPFMQLDDTVSLRCGDYYVQLAQLPEVLHAEAVSNTNLPPSLQLEARAMRDMERLGWRQPQTEPWGYDNWWDDLPWPISADTGSQLAKRLVCTMRDVFNIPSPSQLRYRAWHYTTNRKLTWKIFESLQPQPK